MPITPPPEAPPPAYGEVIIADEIIVSELVVTRQRTPQDDAPTATTITRQELDARQTAFAADILETVPGVALARNGAYGGITSVLMRGASNDKTLVLVDGVIQNDAAQPAGGFDFANLQLDDIQRIEILHGPQAALWGSDAIGGVIAFTTREPEGLSGNIEGGTYNTVRGGLAAGAHGDRWAFGVTGAGFRTDGISKADGFPERDPFWSWSLTGSAKVTLTDWLTLDGKLRYDRSRAEVDGYAPPFFDFGDTADWTSSAAWTGYVRARIDGPWGVRHSLTFTADDLDRSASGIGFTSRRRDYRWQADWSGAGDRYAVTVGAERDETRANISTGDLVNLSTSSAFVIARAKLFDRLTLTGSLRYDDPDAFAGRATSKVGAVLTLGAGFSLYGDWGQGFKTPTISELACDFCFPAGPSVNLRPERAEGWDGGLRWRSEDGRYEAEVTGFSLDVTDQISYGVGRYVNLNHTKADGIEASASARLTDHLTLKGAYTHTRSEDLSTHLALIRVTPDVGSVSLLWTSNRWTGALTVRAESARLDTDPSLFSAAMRPGFAVADLALGWRLTERLEVTGRIENLADRHYQQSLGYGEPGRVVMLGLRLRN